LQFDENHLTNVEVGKHFLWVDASISQRQSNYNFNAVSDWLNYLLPQLSSKRKSRNTFVPT